MVVLYVLNEAINDLPLWTEICVSCVCVCVCVCLHVHACVQLCGCEVCTVIVCTFVGRGVVYSCLCVDVLHVCMYSCVWMW